MRAIKKYMYIIEFDKLLQKEIFYSVFFFRFYLQEIRQDKRQYKIVP